MLKSKTCAIERVEWRDCGDAQGVAGMRLEAHVHDAEWRHVSSWACTRTDRLQSHSPPDLVTSGTWRLTFLKTHDTVGFYFGMAVRTLRFFTPKCTSPEGVGGVAAMVIGRAA